MKFILGDNYIDGAKLEKLLFYDFRDIKIEDFTKKRRDMILPKGYFDLENFEDGCRCKFFEWVWAIEINSMEEFEKLLFKISENGNVAISDGKYYLCSTDGYHLIDSLDKWW